MWRHPVLLAFLAFLMLLPGCKRSDPPAAGTSPLAPEGRNLTVKGSDTMVLLGQRWAEEFMKQNAQVSIQVTGGGSGTGIAALVNGTTDIAMSSRAIKPAEAQKVQAQHKTEAREIPVARDGVTFYVHESNPVSALSVAQLKSIYLGDITRWKEVGGLDEPIVLHSRENSSGTYVFVKERVLGDEDFSASTLSLPGTAAVVNAVSKEKNGIGYGGAAYAKGIKPLNIQEGSEPIAPSAENIQSGHYPLSRDLFFYVRGAPRANAQAFIDFVLSPQGQQLVAHVGYYPLKQR
ncbi:phosphate ABC transporter substrate-binding protein [Stigmatella sp. ncwal1]|uniref:Phosphate-binding protein n=1 Tax=Stigmatella ashevillensis TaxID=2995309 RepID=A0ABT5D182_9BACT|nr:phosphate ABC transporter substrate-binding protein [Stigmatella ashevillena]MDC0706888.1 phosphate ABC transporter substrate-binding protein [Stigmatella ashevillena]